MNHPVIVLNRIRKSFGDVEVLHGVDLELVGGEVHSLVGENGAGKSTLMKIAAGIHAPDGGSMSFMGRSYAPSSPLDAGRAGIAMVHQELSLAPDISVAENILVGRMPMRGCFVNWRELNARASSLLADFGLSIDPRTPVSSLSIGCRQVIEVLKALASDPKVIIFDEPTSSLEACEASLVLDTIRRLADRSIGVVYISHRMDEVFRISDRITVLRDGDLVDTWNAADVSREAVVNAMIGREMTELYPAKASSVGDVLLSVDGLTRVGSFKDVSFILRKGEILGFSGLVGAGRTEVMRSIFGAGIPDSGAIHLDGVQRDIRSAKDAMDAGIVYLPEERKTQGLFLERSIEDNILCGNIGRCSQRGVVRPSLSRALALDMCSRLSVRARGIGQELQNLSGGNQQKVLLARWLAMKPRVLIVDEPTRGVDVGAKAEIHRMLRDYASDGNGVIVVSSEMPEIIGLCDRIIVLHEGRISGEVEGTTATEAQLASLAFGNHSSPH